MTSRTGHAANTGGQGNQTLAPPRSPHTGGAAAPVSSPPHPTQRLPHSQSHRSHSSPSVTFSPTLTLTSSSSSSSSSRSRSIPSRLLAPVLHHASRPLSGHHGRSSSAASASSSSFASAAMDRPSLPGASAASPAVSAVAASAAAAAASSRASSAALVARRSRSRSRDLEGSPNHASGAMASPPVSPRPVAAAASSSAAAAAAASPRVATTPRGSSSSSSSRRLRSPRLSRKKLSASASSSSSSSPSPSSEADAALRARARSARLANDSMVYLDGPCVYTCAQCRTHLTSHDDIISKSFHGRHGRAYLFDQCVNVTVGPAEDRLLITGMHSVCDIRCRRCDTMVGWTYKRAYESSQKYKEGKFIVEKINLHMEETDSYDVGPPAGERGDRWRKRAISWGSASDGNIGDFGGGIAGYPHSPRQRDRAGSENIVYEYRPDGGDAAARLGVSPAYRRTRSLMAERSGASLGGDGGGAAAAGGRALPPGPPNL